MLPSTELAAATIARFSRGGASVQPPSPLSTNNNANVIKRLNEVYRAYYTLPETVRFLTAGTVGNVSFFLLERFVFDLLKKNSEGLPAFLANHKESVSFSMTYLVQIIPQHWLNAFLCYGMETINTRKKYTKTLLGTYSALSFTLFLSTVLNVTFNKLGMNKDFAFFLTLFLGAFSNYFLLTYVVQKSNTGTPKTTNPLEEDQVCLEGIIDNRASKQE